MILADENIIAAVIARLRADGWDVVSVAEVSPSIDDAAVLSLAARDGRVLLTDDKDFGELVVREGQAHSGVVLLRLAGTPVAERAEMVSRLFAASMKELIGAFTVVDRDGRVRVRKAGKASDEPEQ